ncbi:MAG: hypothetical protein QOI63_1396 [Thermoplasmata archaeon]|jgi:hypothetical protein|nr:hypothetical protein [Thermoplasmata archaeon]
MTPKTLLLALLFGSASVLAAPMGAAPDLSGGVVNVPPTLVSVTLGSSSLTPTAGTTTSLVTTIVVSDLNGFNDISSVLVTILKPDGTTVHVAAAAASFVSGSGVQATYTKTSTMNYADAAALTTSTYKVKVTATDSQGAAVNNLLSLGTFNYAQLAALNSPSSLDLGSSLSPGDTSAIGALAISNYGNIQIDTQVSGTAPAVTSPAATLPIGSVTYSLNSNMASSSALSTSAVTAGSFDLGAGVGNSKNLYWQMAVPTGASQYVPAGTYTSTVTVTAVAG